MGTLWKIDCEKKERSDFLTELNLRSGPILAALIHSLNGYRWMLFTKRNENSAWFSGYWASLWRALVQGRQGKIVSEQWNSEPAKIKGKKEGESLYASVIPHPLSEKPFFVSKCEMSKRQKIRWRRISHAWHVCQTLRARSQIMSQVLEVKFKRCVSKSARVYRWGVHA